MTKLILIIGLCFSLQIFAQNRDVPPQTIKEIKQIDSLFRQIDMFYFAHLEINYITNKLKLLQCYNYDSKTNKVDSLEMTTKLDSLTIRQYCIKTKTKFETVYNLLDLMIKNKFISLSPAGPGDCADCSMIIYFKKDEAYVVEDLKNRCMPDDCYWYYIYKNEMNGKFKKGQAIKITDNILLVKKPME